MSLNSELTRLQTAKEDIKDAIEEMGGEVGEGTIDTYATAVRSIPVGVGTETDPVFTNSPAYGITSNDITNWNGKSTFSGSYNDLTNKPTIPTKLSDLTDDLGSNPTHTHSQYLTSHQSLSSKQDVLVSGTNIKTINNQSILGSGNITISGGSSSPYIYTGTNTADDIEAFESIIDEYNQTGKWDLDYIIYKNTTVMRDVQIRMNEATLLSATSYAKNYRFIFKGDYQATNTQYNTTLYGKATVVWLNGDYRINFEVETVDNIAPLDNNLQYDRKVLTTDNTTSFTPTNDYHPATKKYVDDCISSKLDTSKIKNTNSTTAGDVYDVRYVNSVLGDISTVLASLVNDGGGN